ncbi:M20/M25/M40 family metallo-hydrolase [Actinoplanes bogorensis]|uniref:M20/M25/M40 family metallo-hydrolase n=1 Tax=Paractinoplanes bogorensis TaxID=1610840 RepID=A0ABS5YXU0_9ACTN|nr:M20/M25/M40 family metallo-hydrolase [Actinoplanes bogorensis]MBU2668146.1 M20/M25/M40 family metallo-hydrolase [Actinoplanes bogorensis]
MKDRLGHLVGLETPSGDAARLTAAYDLVSAWFARLGRAPERVVVDGVPHLYWAPLSSHSVLLLGHIDTVWPAGTVDRRPFTVTGDRVTGPGVFDMKAGVVLAAEAVARVADPSGVAVLLTGDEEVGSVTSRALLERAASGCRAVLVTEPSLDGDLKTARKGCASYEVTFSGRAAHAGLEPERGHNALAEMAALVTHCATLADRARETTVTPTLAVAGSALNVVPASARLTLDVRSWDLAELERVDAAVRGFRTGDPAVTIEVGGGVNRPPMPVSASAGLAGLAQRLAAGLGLAVPGTVAAGGASDGNFTAALGIPTLDGLGAIGGGAHAESEWVDLPSLEGRAALLTALIDALHTGGEA